MIKDSTVKTFNELIMMFVCDLSLKAIWKSGQYNSSVNNGLGSLQMFIFSDSITTCLGQSAINPIVGCGI